MLRVTDSSHQNVSIDLIDDYGVWWNKKYTSLQDDRPNAQTVPYRTLQLAFGTSVLLTAREWIGGPHAATRWYLVVEGHPVFVERRWAQTHETDALGLPIGRFYDNHGRFRALQDRWHEPLCGSTSWAFRETTTVTRLDEPCILYCADETMSSLIHAIGVLTPIRQRLRKAMHRRALIEFQRHFQQRYYHPMNGAFLAIGRKRWNAGTEDLARHAKQRKYNFREIHSR